MTGGGPFADLRVVELGGEAGRWCGRLLAEMGADVIKVEPPGGSDEREVGPYYRDEPHRERSLSFWHYNCGKRGVTLDLEDPRGAELFRKLVAEADVLLETTPPGTLPALGLGPEELRGADPRLVYCSLTPFGQDGPWSEYIGTDLVHLAAGGQMASSGYDEEEAPDAPPIAPGGGNAWHIAGHYALLAIATALLDRELTDEGQFLDVSIHDACALTTEMAVPIYFATNRVLRRQTGRHGAWSLSRPHTQFQCEDGHYVNAMFNQRLSPRSCAASASGSTSTPPPPTCSTSATPISRWWSRSRTTSATHCAPSSRRSPARRPTAARRSVVTPGARAAPSTRSCPTRTGRIAATGRRSSTPSWASASATPAPGRSGPTPRSASPAAPR